MNKHTKFKTGVTKLIVLFLFVSAIGSGKIYFTNAAENSKILNTKYNVLPNHEFTVKFSQEPNEVTLNNGSIKVYEKTSLKPVEIVVKKDPYNSNYVKVKAKNDYVRGKTYTLEVKDVSSKKNKIIKNPVKMDFTIKNIYSGLPAENGLIIIDDKAYAVDYLINNIKMVNEIVTKSYDIYYTYDINYEKIYSLFKTGPVDGSSADRKYDEMTFIDALGKKYLYKWREDRNEYQLVPPKANVDVIVRSDAKAVNLNVKNVVAVPDAKYYKIKNSNLIRNIGESILYIASGPTEELSILSQDKSVLAKGTINVDYNNSGDIRLRLSDSLESGNTAANVNNNGIAAEDSEGYIYYVNSADREKLYKAGMGGFYNRMILEDKAQYVNESGDWIYYSNYSDGGKLYKVKKDGTERQKLIDDKAAYITISGQDIYYSNHSEGGRLYRVKKDASDAIIGSDNSKHGNMLIVDFDGKNKIADEVAYINIAGDWIYYSNYSDGHKPYVIHKDGTYRGKISDSWADCVQVQGDWVYFTSGSGVISKIKKSGEGSVIPIKGTTTQFNKGYHINVDGDWIFYSNAEDGGKLYKINTDGSGDKLKMADEPVGYINVVGDWIYFTTTKGKLFRIPRDSKGDIKPEEVTVPKDNNQIAEIQDVYISVDYADVNKPTEWIENKYLPHKVPAIMKDNTIQQLVVVWDTDKVSSRSGVRTYKGSVVGFNKTINLYMTIPSEMFNDTNKFTVYKNGNKNDMLIVEGNLEPNYDKDSIRIRMKEGDVIKVYEDSLKKKVLGTSTVGKNGTATVNRLDLDAYGKSFYVTITRVNKAESNPTEIKQYMPSIINPEEVMDKDYKGLALDLRDFTINSWIPSMLNPFEDDYLSRDYRLLNQEIYILPSNTVLDMFNHKSLIKNLPMTTKAWDGTNLSKEEAIYQNRDSKGTAFRQGKYDVYVAASYYGFGSQDIENHKPLVEGKISNGTKVTFDMVEEKIPNKPTIKVQRVQGYLNNNPNALVTLDKPLAPGEEAWLVPTILLDKVRGWKAELTPSPFEALLKAGEDLAVFSGSSNIMPAPKGDIGNNPKDIDYKLFIVNGVGASAESDNRITVDNSKPIVTVDKNNNSLAYDVGDPITVRSSEKGKVYIVDSGISEYNIASLEEACKVKNGILIQHSGNNLGIPVYGTESLLGFISKVGLSDRITYNVVAIDEAGNISVPVPITINRKYSDLEFAIQRANDEIKKSADAGIVLKELVDSVKKAESLKTKPNVKQSEINASVNEILSKIGGLSKDTSLSSRSSKIDVSGEYAYAAQMPIREFLNNVFNKNGAVIAVLDKDGNQIIDGNKNIETGMKVRVTPPSSEVAPGLYNIKIVKAYPFNGDELKAALLNPEIDTINLSDVTYELNLDKDIVLNRVLKIEGSNMLNLSKIKFTGTTGKFINKGDLELKNITFIGTIVDNFIVNEGALNINGCTFNEINFDNYVGGGAIIASKKAAKLNVNNRSNFADINSGDKELSIISIEEGAAIGTIVDTSTFNKISGKNVKGIKISGQTSNNEVTLKGNTFTNFSAGVQNSMATPIYIDGGNVTLTGNRINNSESGIWIEATGNTVRTGIYTINISNVNEVAKNIALSNTQVNGNLYGDVTINIQGQLPFIYNNSRVVPSLDSIKTDSGKLVVDTNDKKNPTNVIKYAFNESVIKIPTSISVGYNDYTAEVALDPSKKFIVVLEVDASGNVVRGRQIYIP